jgi:hypothetical protein
MDHQHDTAPVDGPWAGGWLIAALAGIFAIVVAKWVGEVGNIAAALLGGVTFLVHGVLLGAGGVVLSPGHGDGHDHGHH